jgi:hypothetical protein
MLGDTLRDRVLRTNLDGQFRQQIVKSHERGPHDVRKVHESPGGPRSNHGCKQQAEAIPVGIHPAHGSGCSCMAEDVWTERVAPASRSAARVQTPAQSPRPRLAHGVGNVWLIDEAVGRHCLHRARRQQPNIAVRSAVRSAVEKQLTDDRKFITACSASSRSSGAKPSQSISAPPVKSTRKHQFNLTYPFAQSLLRAPLPAPAQKP